jgi:hypothetical protein
MTTSEHPDGYEYADEDTLLAVFDDAQAALVEAHVRFLVMGGIASSLLGRPRWTHDIDIFLRPEETGRALDALEAAGFQTSIEHEHWLAKARKRGLVVDVIFRSSGDILLDEEMFARSVPARFKDRDLRLVPPEDLVVMKAVASSEETPRYWFDAIAIIGHTELDWDYLVRRARPVGVRRVLSLLLYAQSVDIIVPARAIRAMVEMLLEPSQNQEMSGAQP